MPTKADRMKVPKFATEAEEAKWWDEHMDVVEEDLIAAMNDGTAQRNTAARLVKEARKSRTITIRLPNADIELARRLAEQKGLGYQTYMKSLLHEALAQEEKRYRKTR
jgi:predicted DNA binding CopG/RHH family protein